MLSGYDYRRTGCACVWSEAFGISIAVVTLPTQWGPLHGNMHMRIAKHLTSSRVIHYLIIPKIILSSYLRKHDSNLTEHNPSPMSFGTKSILNTSYSLTSASFLQLQFPAFPFLFLSITRQKKERKKNNTHTHKTDSHSSISQKLSFFAKALGSWKCGEGLLVPDRVQESRLR